MLFLLTAFGENCFDDFKAGFPHILGCLCIHETWFEAGLDESRLILGIGDRLFEGSGELGDNVMLQSLRSKEAVIDISFNVKTFFSGGRHVFSLWYHLIQFNIVPLYLVL